MKKYILSLITVCSCLTFIAQEQNEELQISGNFQVLAQSYNEDSLIRADVPDELMTLNSFANIIARKGNFQAGLRYESYLPSQLGYPTNFKGSGIGYRFASYKDDGIAITVGNFYEQFGNGLTLRSFEDRNLGLENALDGVRVLIEPIKGLTVKGVYGKMRLDFDGRIINSEGFVRGLDGELSLNEAISGWEDKKTKITLGASFVSKFQADDRLDLNLPENVGNYSGRINVIHGNWRMMAEVAEKINDPSADNAFIFNKGIAILGNLTYSQKGFAISGDVKYIDNYSYRADRALQGIAPFINFMPALTKQHSYMLASQFYAYATQPTGEFAYMGEVSYKFKKDTPLGGKYGTQINLNYSRATGIEKNRTSTEAFLENGVTYESPLFSSNGEVYFSDFNAEIKKKFSKKVKTKFTYFNFIYNNTINQGAPLLTGKQVKGNVYADVFVAEANIKTKSKQNLRIVAQGLRTNQHQGDWVSLVMEYTISPHWNFALLDSYNFGNKIDENKLHYPLGSLAYSEGAHRLSFEYGKRRAGLFCVGGVCRVVPASNGLTLTLTSSF
ncbi:MAG TPA: hypothetical protein DHU89_05720 [Flavobacteriales bacterium]|nr:hypothetical protein [Flavobacteriales bacterium]|tara:strand:+ start:11839 stop:13512 length:1674 start_codon:yes stop_codon:yes gene_type:complete